MTLYQQPFKRTQGPKLTLGVRKACRGRVLLGWLFALVSFFAGQWFEEIIPSGSILTQISGTAHFLWGV